MRLASWPNARELNDRVLTTTSHIYRFRYIITNYAIVRRHPINLLCCVFNTSHDSEVSGNVSGYDGLPVWRMITSLAKIAKYAVSYVNTYTVIQQIWRRLTNLFEMQNSEKTPAEQRFLNRRKANSQQRRLFSFRRVRTDLWLVILGALFSVWQA